MSLEGENLLSSGPKDEDQEGCPCCTLEYDPQYFKTAEGILRIISIVLAASGMVFVIASSFAYVGIFFFSVATVYIMYSIFVIILEDILCLLGVSGLMSLATLLNTLYGVKKHEGHLGVAALSGLTCVVTITILIVVVIMKFRARGNHRLTYL